MGLKITTQIGTDKGITNEAYIRISSYNIQKSGQALFIIELYMVQPIPQELGETPVFIESCLNREIGNSFLVILEKSVKLSRTIQVPIQKDIIITEIITTPSLIEGESPIETSVEKTETRTVMEDVIENYDIMVPDLSILNDVSIFTFAYGKLKEKLQTSFGIENVIDC